MIILLSKVTEVFGYSEISNIARNILERIDEDETDAGEAVSEAIDSGLIYTGDQWTVIAYYSDPESPKNLSEACEDFYGDLLECVEEEEGE